MTLKEIRGWTVFHPRSTVSNDVTRAASAKDAAFSERWARVREFGYTHPSVKPLGNRFKRTVDAYGSTYGGTPPKRTKSRPWTRPQINGGAQQQMRDRNAKVARWLVTGG